MANHQSVEEILQKARDEQARKLAAIASLATAREAVITAERTHKKRLEDFKRELERELKTVKEEHARHYQAALTTGLSSTELRKLGLSDPRTTKRAPRKRTQPSSTEQSSDLNNAEQQPHGSFDEHA